MDAASVHVVAVPGNGGGPARFARVLPHLPPGVVLSTATLPGFAGRPLDPAIRSLTDFAEALRPIVELSPRPRVLLGHGIGGSIVLDYAQRHSGDVDGLILHAPVGANLDRRRLPRVMAVPGARLVGKLLLTSPVFRPFWRRLLFRRNLPRPVLAGFFDDYRRCAVFGALFDVVTPAWFASLQPSDVPAALLWGGRERLLGVEQAAAFRRLLPRASVTVVTAWDHFPMLETPRDYAQVIGAAACTLAGANRPASA